MIEEAPAKWVRKMRHWLPYYQDQYFIGINHAFAGVYKNRYRPDEAEQPAEHQAAKKAAANRGLDRFSRLADQAIAKYKAKHKRRR